MQPQRNAQKARSHQAGANTQLAWCRLRGAVLAVAISAESSAACGEKACCNRELIESQKQWAWCCVQPDPPQSGRVSPGRRQGSAAGALEVGSEKTGVQSWARRPETVGQVEVADDFPDARLQTMSSAVADRLDGPVSQKATPRRPLASRSRRRADLGTISAALWGARNGKPSSSTAPSRRRRPGAAAVRIP